MSADDEDRSHENTADKSAAQKLAELVARRKAASGQGQGKGVPGHRNTERAAAALSASKSKPAPRKG